MRRSAVYFNKEFAGTLVEEPDKSYVFTYDNEWLSDATRPAVSLTLPKTQREFRSAFLFPFFFNMLSEGVNRQLQCRQLKVDESDDFGLLLATAQEDTIGAVTITPLK